MIHPHLIKIFGILYFFNTEALTFPHVKSIVNFADVPCGRVPRSLSGLAAQNRRSKIIGGSAVLPGEFPWTASIQDSDIHFCAGFAISKRYVVSAAHCFIYYMHGLITEDNIRNMKIVVGANDLKNPNTSSQILRIKGINLHPNFSYFYPDFENDIAIIEIDKDIEWSTTVQPVCLSTLENQDPISAKEEDNDIGGSVVAGWGVHFEDQRDEEWRKEMVLKKVSLPLWKNPDCQKAYMKNGISWRTKDSHICAGYIDGNRDTCRGDSGSALLVANADESTWIARGLVSAGEGCARPGIPGFYTRVSHFIPWISSVISSR